MDNKVTQSLYDGGKSAYGGVIPLQMNHVSVRKFKDTPVSDEQLEAIVAAGQMASTSSNVQAYSVIAVTDPERKARLAELSGSQTYVAECPVFLVWCADLYRLQEASRPYLGGNESYADSTENFIVATVDVALAAQNAALRPRLPLQAVLHRERYDAEETVRQVQAYDETSRAYLRERTGGTKDTPWSAIMAGRLAEPVRLHMKDFLQQRGFMRR